MIWIYLRKRKQRRIILILVFSCSFGITMYRSKSIMAIEDSFFIVTVCSLCLLLCLLFTVPLFFLLGDWWIGAAAGCFVLFSRKDLNSPAFVADNKRLKCSLVSYARGLLNHQGQRKQPAAGAAGRHATYATRARGKGARKTEKIVLCPRETGIPFLPATTPKSKEEIQFILYL